MRPRHCITICLGLLLIMQVACQKDEFSTAPGVEATASSPENRTVAPATRTQQGAGKLPDGATMPPGHPPVAASNVAPTPNDRAPRPQFPVSADKPTGEPGSAGPLLWQAPESWRAVKPSSSMRLAEYHVAAAKEGNSPAVMSIFFFGAQGGGGVDANIDRWIGQFKQADGSSSKDAARRSKQEVNGMTVHLVDVAGSYDAGAAMMGSAPAAGEQRMLGAIVEAPTGLFFFKLLGDPETIAAQEEAFSSFVQSMKPGQGAP